MERRGEKGRPSVERFNPASLRRVDSDGIECSVCNCRSECERIVSWNSNGINMNYSGGGKKIRRFVDSDGIEFGV